MNDRIDSVVIAGRDVSLWLTACVLQSALAATGLRVTAIELPSRLSAQDASVALPPLEALHQRLRIDESRLLSETGGAFSLGQNFLDPQDKVPALFHAYGAYGAPIEQKPFFPYWVLAGKFGLAVALEHFSLTAAAARHGRMLVPDTTTETFGRTDYGYHLPALEYASIMKSTAVRRGVTCVETARLEPVRAESGDIRAVRVDGQRLIDGQLFIDATGSDALLIDAVASEPRESWSEQFVADRVLVAAGPRLVSIPPYAEIRIGNEGWTGLYPGQVRTHLLHAYSSSIVTDEQARAAAAGLAAFAIEEPVVRSLNPGRRTHAWERNCIAIGEAACSFDPLHGVDLHASQLGLVHLLSLFPVSADFAAERSEYNRIVKLGFERLRDYQSAYYATNRHESSQFWSHARQLRVSDELRHKIDTFGARGEVPLYENETFALESWQALFVGQGLLPDTIDPMIERTPPQTVKHEFRRILSFVREKVQEQATHGFYLQALCPAARHG